MMRRESCYIKFDGDSSYRIVIARSGGLDRVSTVRQWVDDDVLFHWSDKSLDVRLV